MSTEKTWKPLINSWKPTTANLPQCVPAKKYFKIDFKENNKIVVCREPYSIILEEVAQKLRNHRRAPLTMICKDFTESGRGNEEDPFKKMLRDR